MLHQILKPGDFATINEVEEHEKLGALTTCLPLVFLLYVAWTFKFAKKDLFQTGGVLYIILVTASFSATSISMNILNKACVSLTGAPSVVTAIQMAFTVAATLAFQWKEVV